MSTDDRSAQDSGRAVWGAPQPSSQRWGVRQTAAAVGVAAVIAGLGAAAIYAAAGGGSPGTGGPPPFGPGHAGGPGGPPPCAVMDIGTAPPN